MTPTFSCGIVFKFSRQADRLSVLTRFYRPSHACWEDMPTAEDNFRIEVWDADERELVETISRSPDHFVSIAAWHASVRRRPGMLLIHRNASFTMDRLVAPGEPEGEPRTKVGRKVLDGVEAMLGDLRSWHSLRAWCHGCGHHGDWVLMA